MHMDYGQSTRSRWLNIGRILFGVFMDKDPEKKNNAGI